MPNGNDNAPTTAVVAVKLPQFWQRSPDLWFAQADAMFRKARVTADDTKYDHILTALPEEELSCIADIVEDVDMAAYGETDTAKITKLIKGLQLGDKKPTVLMREMKTLAGKNMTDSVLKQLFLTLFPISVKKNLLFVEGDLDTIAKKTDELMESSELTVATVRAEVDEESAAAVWEGEESHVATSSRPTTVT